mmetsp:Transcript_21398/g.45587  ORF Transcript_21398/g.45587 Transcript_21398/m.45587 type:complete len:394 (-) Transcript_21398:3-1184(-)
MVDVWKWASLLAFCFQNSLSPIIFRYATTESAAGDRASTSSIIFCTEALKGILSFGFLVLEEGCSLGQAITVVNEDGLQRWREGLRLAVPAVIYALQNALLQWASGHLSAALWQVTYQGKILVTAAFSVVLLQKQIKRVQWLAIAIMGLGITLVQLSDAKETKQTSMGNAAEQNPMTGFMMLVIACCCSGFASVYTEKVFKQVGADASQKKVSVWLQNMQLACFTMLLTFLSFSFETMFPASEGAAVTNVASQYSFLKGFTVLTWGLAVSNAVGGLLVALVIKYADNILRGFASALATINAALIAVFAFGFVLRLSFGAGTLLVVGSTLLYGNVLKLPGEWWDSECHCCAASVRTYEAVPSSESRGSGDAAKAAPGVELASTIGQADCEDGKA